MAKTFLLLNLALAFYNVGTIWAMEIDIFRSWKLVGADFHKVQEAHWKNLPYWIFTPVAAALFGNLVVVWYHPAKSPAWGIYGALLCQLTSLILTAMFWGQWQAKLSKDPLGPSSRYLKKILTTHLIRTLLISAYAFILLAWVIKII